MGYISTLELSSIWRKEIMLSTHNILECKYPNLQKKIYYKECICFLIKFQFLVVAVEVGSCVQIYLVATAVHT